MEELNIPFKEIYTLAKQSKEPYRAVYNEILGFTDRTYQITDEAPVDPTFQDVEPLIATEVTSTVNFVMNTLLARGEKFAKIEVDDVIFKAVNGESSDFTNEALIGSINKNLEKMVDSAFGFLNNSNYYVEIAKSLRECLLLGTGVYTVLETKEINKPFTFRYIPLNNFYYWEDAFGKPNNTFKVHFGLTRSVMEDRFGSDGVLQLEELFGDSEDPMLTKDIIESVVPTYNEVNGETIYNYRLTDTSFEKIILDKQMEYNPFVVFRWSVESDQVIGTGLGAQALKAFKELEDFKEQREVQKGLVLDPPTKATGDKSLIHNVKIKKGYVNYGGTGEADPLTGQPNTFQLEPIISQPTLVPIDNDIESAKNDIRDVFMSNPLGQVGETKSRTATEISERMRIFRNRWSGSFEIMQSELLEPTLVIPIRILLKKDLVAFEDEETTEGFDLTQFKYTNEMSKQADLEEMNKLAGAVQLLSSVLTVAEQSGIEPSRLKTYVHDKFGIPFDLRMTDKEFEEYTLRMQQQMQAQQQMQQQNPQM
jgi:hypothetical protein